MVRAAGSLHIPCVIHESDMTPGLANKLCFRAARKICCNFPETLEMLPKGKAVLTGTPIRGELFTGDKARGLEICGFTADKPVLMIMGGSQGSVSVNNAVRGNLPELLETFQIVHLCGKGHFDENLKDVEGYCQFEYVKEDLKHLFAAAACSSPCPPKAAAATRSSTRTPSRSRASAKSSRTKRLLTRSSPKSQPSTRIGQNISRPSNPATRLTRSRSSWDSWKKCRSERMPGADKAGISLGNYLSRHFARQLFKPAFRPATI